MPMNLIHRRLCSSTEWAHEVEHDTMPWVLEGLDLGPDVLEVGPGYGATTRVLATRVAALTALEVDEGSVMRLTGEFDERVRIVHGDGAAMPFEDERFSAVLCFTMLHHVPSPGRQDELFAEAARVLRPGGTFAGVDSRISARLRAIHVGDTLVPVPPDTLPARLEAAGFTDVRVDPVKGRFRFRAARAS